MRLRVYNTCVTLDARVVGYVLVGTFLVTSFCLILDGVSTNQFKIKQKLRLFLQAPPTLDASKRYVCLSRGGRMGNHMFQYASIYGIARKYNLTILEQEDHDLVQYFTLPSAKILPSTAICKSFQKLKEEKCCTYDPSVTSFPENTSYVIGDYLQSWRYFKDYYPDVKHELTFKPHILASARFILQNLKQSSSRPDTCIHGDNVTTVGVHVRLGDMFEFSRGDSGFDVAPEGYIQRAVEYVLARFDCVLFIVCSDGMDYAKQIFQYRNVSVEFVQLSAIQDMAVLASCDHVIMTVGTFGWWAGFLSGGVVVYYKYPMREGLPGRNNYNYDDFFLPSWVGLP